MKKTGIIDLCMRVVLFGIFLSAYAAGKDIAKIVADTPFFGGFTPLHLGWGLLLASILVQMIPNRMEGACNNKQFGGRYVKLKNGYDRQKLAREIRTMNRDARSVLLFWLCLNAGIAALYFTDIISGSTLLLVVMVYYLCDAFCMAIFCPIKTIFLHGRCCVDCRIYGWGSFLIFGLCFLIPTVFTIGIAALSAMLMIRWEVRFALHAERFWSGSNENLSCAHCNNPICATKKEFKRTLQKKLKGS